MVRYQSMDSVLGIDRRLFLQGLGSCTVLAGGAMLGVPPAYGAEEEKDRKPGKALPTAEVVTNIDDFMKVPRTKWSIPGSFPGQVVEVRNPKCFEEDQINSEVVQDMVGKGICRLTGKDLKESFRCFFTPEDVVGLKVNPVGPPLISTRLEVTEAVIRWLVDSGLPKENIVIWDRFESMLKGAGFTPENFPGVRIEGLQTMDEEGDGWRGEDGLHVSTERFDRKAYYFAKGIEGKKVSGHKDDEFYLNQHVFNNEYSYFGKLITQKLTKIVNLPAFKNTGNGISMATKNLGYGAICNTGRLHVPLFFRVCTEVVAAPWIRDKLVLNITDGLRGQYDQGPGLNAQFVYKNNALYFATDPFALDMVCHRELVEKRKAEGVKVDANPRYTDYLHQGEHLGLGIANPEKIDHIKVTA